MEESYGHKSEGDRMVKSMSHLQLASRARQEACGEIFCLLYLTLQLLPFLHLPLSLLSPRKVFQPFTALLARRHPTSSPLPPSRLSIRQGRRSGKDAGSRSGQGGSSRLGKGAYGRGGASKLEKTTSTRGAVVPSMLGDGRENI